MPKGQRKYNGAQKVEIIKQLHNEKLSFYEASSKYGIPRRTLQDWERIYLEEGEEALLVEPVPPVGHRKAGSQSWISK